LAAVEACGTHESDGGRRKYSAARIEDMTTSCFITHAARDRTASRVASVSFRLFSGQVRAAGKNPYLPSWNDTLLAVFE
jgi:hypothetical protein